MKSILYNFFIIILLSTFSCSNDDNNSGNSDDDSEILDSDIEFNEEDVSYNLATLKWSAVAGTVDEKMVYDIYLEDEKIKDSNTDLDYTLTNLLSNKEYSGRIVQKTLVTGKSSTASKTSEKLNTISFAFKTKQFANANDPSPEFDISNYTNITSTEATVEWLEATISDNSDITYSIYLEGDLVAHTLTSTTAYTFEELEPKTTYEGVILAISSNLRSTAVGFEFTTLPDSDEVALTSFNFFRGVSASFSQNDWVQLIPIFSPVNANAVNLSWTSSDESVVRLVNQYGYINTDNPGTAIITATSIDNPSITSSIEIVVDGYNPGPTLSMSPLRSSLLIGESIEMQANLFGSDNDSFEFTTSDSSIATVNSNGVVTGQAEGTVAITVSSTVNNISESVSVMLRIVSTPIPIESLSFYDGIDEYTLYRQNIGRGIGVFVEPIDATDQTLIYTSTNENVISLNGSSAYPIGVGEASVIITVAANNAISLTRKYTVIESPNSYDENTGIYKANPNTTASLAITGYLGIPANSDPEIIAEVTFSAKNSNGDELINNSETVYTTTGETDSDTGEIFVFLNLSSEDFIMPDNGEVIIDFHVNFINIPFNFPSSNLDLEIRNSEGLTVRSPLTEDRVTFL